MAVSNVSIANAALSKIGASRIMSLDDNRKEAREVNASFERVRDSEIRARLWRFSIKRAELAAQSDAPAFGYDYAYRIPADCLKIIAVGDFLVGAYLSDYVGGEDGAPFALENGLILSNDVAPLNLRYVAQITNPTQFDSCFVELFACKLAMEICEAITQSSQKRQLAFEEYKLALRNAVKSNAIENPPVKAADDSWMLARL